MRILFSFFLTVFFFFPSIWAQNLPVQLKVNMKGHSIHPQGISVAGNFQSLLGGSNWTPGSLWLSDPDQDSIYEINFQLPQGRYYYKFINGNSWSDPNELLGPDCGASDGGINFNRLLIVGKNGVNMPAHGFDACEGLVTFRVDMQNESVDPIGVFVTGDWIYAAGYGVTWETDALPLFDPDGDNIYETVAYIQDSANPQRFLYYNGNSISSAEQPNGPCMSPTALVARNLIPSSLPQKLTPVCFGSCDPCSFSIDTNLRTYWWNEKVFYQIFVRSFYDSDGNGIGDFQGLIQKLDYLNDGDSTTHTDLGIDGIWLMPINSSPSYHGYDVTDYQAINPDYGSMADFEAFLDSAHARGIKVIMDYVMNHSSSQHPWFQASRSSPSSPFRDWYIWRNTNPGFNGPWGQGVWHSYASNFYYGLFWGGMPDLNYDEPAVKTEIFNSATFWLNKGVDGFRLDAIKYLDEDFPVLENTPRTFALIEEFKQTLLNTNPEVYTVGEVWSNTSSILPYVDSTRMDHCFEFDLASNMLTSIIQGQSSSLQNHLNFINTAYPPLQFAPFLSNHDQDRVFSVLAESTPRMKQAAALLLAMPGTPFIYYGEELGMTGTGAHENIRTPMQWSSGQQAGFTAGTPWHPVNSNYTNRNVQLSSQDPNSLLNLYKKLIAVRQNEVALQKGYYLAAENTHPSVLGFMRIHRQEAILVLSNMSDQNANSSSTLTQSTLQAGSYWAVDLLEGDTLGSMVLDGVGGFQFSYSLLGRQTVYLKLIAGNGVSLEERERMDGITVYPNPAKDKLYIRFNAENPSNRKLEWTLTDALGRLQMEGVSTDEKIAEISIQSLSAGLYSLELTDEKGMRWIEQILVQ